MGRQKPARRLCSAGWIRLWQLLWRPRGGHQAELAHLHSGAHHRFDMPLLLCVPDHSLCLRRGLRRRHGPLAWSWHGGRRGLRDGPVHGWADERPRWGLWRRWRIPYVLMADVRGRFVASALAAGERRPWRAVGDLLRSTLDTKSFERPCPLWERSASFSNISN